MATDIPDYVGRKATPFKLGSPAYPKDGHHVQIKLSKIGYASAICIDGVWIMCSGLTIEQTVDGYRRLKLEIPLTGKLEIVTPDDD